MRTHPLLSALLATGLVSAASAQTAPAPAPVEPAASAVVIQQPAAAPAATREQDTLSVDFPDEDIRNILRNVADLFELNLVVPDSLQGKTSIKLRDVSWRQIFQVVLSPVGYTYVEEGNIIKVVSQESLAQEPLATEVFILNYARAQDITSSVAPLVDSAAGGKIVVDARSNALVISERPSRMSRVREIIEKLDKATEQVMIESKFVEVTDRDVKNIGVNWASLQNYQVGVGGMTQTWERGRTQEQTGKSSTSSENSLSDKGTFATAIDPTRSTTSFPTGAVTIPGRSNPTVSAGSIDSTTTTPDSGVSTATEAINSNALSQLLDIASGGTTSRAATAVFSASDFSLVISALQSQNNVKLVSNPTVVTLNNTEANINIGEEYPIPNYTYNQERGTFEVSGFTYRPIGIILKVTPQVNSRGFIKLTVEPEVSSRSGTTTFGGAGGAEIPIIATRKSKTQISLKDGFTMGIGGLIENTSSNGQTKVPVLGNIPGVGRLFRSDSKNIDSRNLLIFITAKTVNAEGGAIEEIFDPRAIRSMGLRRDELPGYRDGSDPFAPVQPEGKAKKKK